MQAGDGRNLGERLEHVDVLVVGAGLAGVGAAARLRQRLPHKRVLVVEARDAIGGTWDLFRYPGIRSDSDMFTLGYPFRPWTDSKTLADGEAIRAYIRDTADAYGVTSLIRFQRRVIRLSWHSAARHWLVELERTDTGEREQLTAGFISSCTGYYRYDEGYTPAFPGAERFRGRVVHPQHWPEELDPSGKRFVVIGSGATAVTLVPALAARGAHVTMLQRSPSYILPLPGRDHLAGLLLGLLPARAASAAIRWKNILASSALFKLSRSRPRLVRGLIRRLQQGRLPADFDHATHLSPRYEPWDERLCVAPDGDLFTAVREGRAEIVTDTIASFTEDGILLGSGRTLAADVVVTATGLQLMLFGGMELEVDGRPVSVPDTVSYRGMMLTGVPNLIFTVGYTNASWTLKADLVAEFTCRLLAHMEAHGHDRVEAAPPPAGEPREPLINLTSGYVRRGEHLMPQQVSRAPWAAPRDYLRDRRVFRRGPLPDEALRFSGSGPGAAPAAPGSPADTPVSGCVRPIGARLALWKGARRTAG